MQLKKSYTAFEVYNSQEGKTRIYRRYDNGMWSKTNGPNEFFLQFDLREELEKAYIQYIKEGGKV